MYPDRERAERRRVATLSPGYLFTGRSIEQGRRLSTLWCGTGSGERVQMSSSDLSSQGHEVVPGVLFQVAATDQLRDLALLGEPRTNRKRQ